MPEEPEIFEPQYECHRERGSENAGNTAFIHPEPSSVSNEKSEEMNRIQNFVQFWSRLGRRVRLVDLIL